MGKYTVFFNPQDVSSDSPEDIHSICTAGIADMWLVLNSAILIG